MFTVDIRKELEKSIAKRQRVNKQEQEQEVAFLKSLLEGEHEKDKKMLNYFGTADVINVAANKAHMRKELSNSSVLTCAEIEEVCKKYGLACLPARQYKERIPASVLNNLRKYTEGIKVIMESDRGYCGKMELKDGTTRRTDIKRELFVIAPPPHFKTTGRTISPRDPILLFRTYSTFDDESTFDMYSEFIGGSRIEHQTCLRPTDEFTIIDKWGNDFTMLRRLVGLFKYSGRKLFFIAMCYAAIIVAYWLFIGANWHTMLYTILIPLFALIALLFRYTAHKDEWCTI